MTKKDLKHLEKVRKQNEWLKRLCNYEPLALSLLKPVDLKTFDPVLVDASQGDNCQILDYFRVVLSSAVQSHSMFGISRSSQYLMLDKETNAFLGLFVLCDISSSFKQFDAYMGWSEEPLKSKVPMYNHRAIQMKRCIPLFDFGQMAGGKLLTLAATSREIIRVMELKYNFQYLWFVTRTLHGKSSQYNRLQQRGLELIDVDSEDRGMYVMELRKKATRHFKEGVPVGKSAMFSLEDQIKYWRERWLPLRMQSQGSDGVIRPDPEKYRLTAMLDAKKKLIELDRGEDHGSE